MSLSLSKKVIKVTKKIARPILVSTGTYNFAKRITRQISQNKPRKKGSPPIKNDEYWNEHNVTYSHRFTSREGSLDYLNWRNGQYLFYDQLMPCSGFDNKTVLEYGCGPGHDVVGFIECSKPKKVFAADVAPHSLALAKERAAFHPAADLVEYVRIDENNVKLPMEDNSVDYIHSSGVLHHIIDIKPILHEFQRVLKPDGQIRIMIYNYESIYVQLNIAYHHRIVQKLDCKLTLAETFRKNTDGENCPTSRYYTPQKFIDVGTKAGFNAKYIGAAISTVEMNMLSHRYNAIMCQELPIEHRDFLGNLTFDHYQRPIYQGHVAGIDGVFEFTKQAR